MEVSKEEILHIAKLANIKIDENEIENYRENLQEILNFTKTLNNVNTENVDEALSGTNSFNVFREDKIIEFEDKELLLQNAPEKENNMFKIPKVIQD